MLTTDESSGRDEGGGCKYDSVYPDFYRCPVSTPANNQKRPLDDYEPIIESVVPGVQDRKSSMGFVRPSVSRNKTRDIAKPMRKNVEYYFVDSGLQRKELNLTNTYWLQSLCAQPVTEILGKYRRKSDFQRTRFMWSKMFSTPGERALLTAWTKSSTKSQRASTSPVSVGGTQQRQHLTLSKELKVNSSVSLKSAGSRKSDSHDSRGQFMSDAGSHLHYDSKSESQSMSRESPVMRQGAVADDTEIGRIVLADNEVLPNLSGQKRKGQIILQQRKYFSGNRRHPAIPHVQRLNPVKTEDIAQNADVICLKPTQKPTTPRVVSRPGSRDPEKAVSKPDAQKVQVKFPLIVSTKPDGEEESNNSGQKDSCDD